MVQAHAGFNSGVHAGLTGALMAASLLHHGSVPPIACLRSMNPYVSTTNADWENMSLQAAIPRQLAPGTGILPGLCVGEILLSVLN